MPACIVRPRSAQDVSKAVTILASSRSRVPGCQFAVKGGGHTPAGGAANIQGGVTIDMKFLNATVLSEDKNSVAVGAGAVWNDVYGYLGDFNLAAAGGRNGGVGVGGLLLGGGISHFSPRVGWACDGVVEFEARKLVAPSMFMFLVVFSNLPKGRPRKRHPRDRLRGQPPRPVSRAQGRWEQLWRRHAL